MNCLHFPNGILTRQGPLNKTTLFDFRFQWININVCIFICIRQPSHGARAVRLHSRKGSYLSINNQLMWRSVDRAAVSPDTGRGDIIHMESCILHRHHMAAAISQQHKPWWPISTRHHGIIVVEALDIRHHMTNGPHWLETWRLPND